MADDTQTNGKPWWAPDAQGFVIGAVVFMVAVALFYRMTHPAEINDKLLDMMLTILFGTAFVAIINYLVGSSRGSQAKDETQNKIMEKLTSAPPGGPVAPVPSPPAVEVPWWNRLTDAERTAITAAANDDPGDTRLVSIATGPVTIKPNPDDLAYLVTKGLLTQDRATAIQGA